LDLRFADNKTLRDSASGSEMVTFTRASSGTYVGSDGVIRTAVTNEPRFDHNPTTGESLGLLVEESRTNLLLQSNQFDTTWTNTNSSETAAAGTAPDGTNTAWELKDTADAVSTAHSLVQSPSTSFTSGVAYTFSCWMKAGTLTEGGLVFPGSAFTTAINCRINLSTGAVISSSATVSASTVPYANGWYRVIATATATATATGAVNIRPGNGALSYIGTGTGTILVWGAQIEAGSPPTSYIPTTTATVTRSADVPSITGANFGTTRTNLLLRSEEFDNASWNSAAGARSVTANNQIAPDGTTTADTITADGTSAAHFVSQSVVFSTVSYAYSVFAKAGTNNFLQLRAFSPVGGMFANFNLSTGVVGTVGTGTGSTPTSSIQAYANGWYRCTMVFTPTTATTSSVATYIVDSASAGGGATNSLSTSIYLWGAQLEVGSAVTPYIPTTTAAVSVFESSWYRQDEGTWFAQHDVRNTGAAGTGSTILSANNNAFNERQPQMGVGTGLLHDFYSITGGAIQANAVGGAHVVGTPDKVVFALKANDFIAALNGTLFGADNSGLFGSSITQLNIGALHNSTLLANGPIRRITYWPVRLANNVLQEITR
jgi:hypothetical protein